MGAVYEAFDPEAQKPVALKVLIAGEHGSPSLLQRFQREATAGAALSHASIAKVLDSGVDGPQHFLVMELVEGKPLSDLLRDGPLPIDRAVGLAARLCDALAHAHEHGVVHRDLKPANILVAAGDVPKILDFGLAKALSEETRLTRTGEIVGTPAYMAPEQAFDAAIDHRADLYSLGAVLYEMLTGSPPFNARSVMSVLRQLESEDPKPPGEVNPGVPAALEAVVLRCLEKSPDKRFQSAAELSEALAMAALDRSRRLFRKKTIMRVLAMAAVSAAVSIALLLSRAPANLLRNGSFEDSDMMQHWIDETAPGDAAIDTTTARDGRRSLRVRGSRFCGPAQRIDSIPRGKKVRLSGWLRIQGRDAALVLMVQGGDGRWNRFLSRSVEGVMDWTWVSVEAQIPSDCRGLNVQIYCTGSPQVRTVWADGLSLSVVDP